VLSRINFDCATGSTAAYNTTRVFEQWSILNSAFAVRDAAAHVPLALPSPLLLTASATWQHRTFCALLTLQWTSALALPQESAPSCLILTFRKLFFADHPHVFFPSGDYRTDPFWTTSTRFDLQQTFITTLTFSPVVHFLLGPYSPIQILFVIGAYCFLFRVVSSFVCINLILEWTIIHSCMFLCNTIFCIFLLNKISSSLVDSSLQHALDLFRVLCPCQFLEGDTES